MCSTVGWYSCRARDSQQGMDGKACHGYASGMAETALSAETSLRAITLKLALAPVNSAQAAIKRVVIGFFMGVRPISGVGSGG